MGRLALDRFPLFHAKDPAQVEQGLIRSYDVRKFDLPAGSKDFEAAANKIQLPHVCVSFCQYKIPVQIDFPEADYVSLPSASKTDAHGKVAIALFQKDSMAAIINGPTKPYAV